MNSDRIMNIIIDVVIIIAKVVTLIVVASLVLVH